MISNGSFRGPLSPNTLDIIVITRTSATTPPIICNERFLSRPALRPLLLLFHIGWKRLDGLLRLLCGYSSSERGELSRLRKGNDMLRDGMN